LREWISQSNIESKVKPAIHFKQNISTDSMFNEDLTMQWYNCVVNITSQSYRKKRYQRILFSYHVTSVAWYYTILSSLIRTIQI